MHELVAFVMQECLAVPKRKLVLAGFKNNHTRMPFIVVALPGWVGDHERATSFKS
jgi:hypothetical protein